ncbi:MAG: hypothetical protein AB7T49_03630 [Oligoflexales bacterium]
MKALILLAMICVSCTATMVSPSTVDSAYAPVNSGTKTGIVKYLNQGADSVIKARREDAYKQMFDNCSGKYKIDAEGPRTEGGYVTAVSSSAATWGDIQYWYIQFSCVKE